jgi:hypothetical protein
MRALAAVAAVAVGAVTATEVVSAPPPDADLSGPLHAWFDRQHNVRGGWCCQLADGHILEGDDWRIVGAQYEVRIAGRWHRISDDKLRDPAGGPNPTGKAVVWYVVVGEVVAIYCFAPGVEL